MIEELKRLIEAARMRLAEVSKYVPLTDEEWEYLFG